MSLDNVKLSIKNLDLFYGDNQALKNINIDIKKGSTVGIVGGNGSGKSVLFKLICGFISPDSGEVYIRNEKLG